MSKSAENPINCEENPANHELRQLVAVYGQNIKNNSSVRKQWLMFNNGRKNEHDEE